MHNILQKYIPKHAVSPVCELLTSVPVTMKIVKKRTSKHGDFRVLPNGKMQITVNNDLNPYQFLITLIHELAHFHIYYEKKRDKKPHGSQWKEQFRLLMLPFLNPEVFPSELLPHLANYLKNPKASTSSDLQLSYALKQFDVMSGKSFIFELSEGNRFTFKNKTYVLGKKRRTRFECLNVHNNRIYLFNQNAEIERI